MFIGRVDKRTTKAIRKRKERRNQYAARQSANYKHQDVLVQSDISLSQICFQVLTLSYKNQQKVELWDNNLDMKKKKVELKNSALFFPASL